MAISVPAVSQSLPASSFTATTESTTFDERWAAWKAKGAAHDRAFRAKVILAAPILIIVAAVIAYAVVGR